MTVERRIDEHIASNIEDRITDLSELCAIASVSSQAHALRPCAEAVASKLDSRGFDVRIFDIDGPPLVYAEIGDGPRCLLLYNHYDVQPPEPLELWTTPPFTLDRRDGALYARGAIDDKGEFVSRLAAFDAYRATHAALPYRMKFLVEGGEEVGSPGMERFVRNHADMLAADACIWEAGGIDAGGRPLVGLGLRGILYVELSVQTMTRDTHSGDAHALPNAVWRLLWAAASMKDQDERVKILGFYDHVRPPSETVRLMLEQIPSPAAAWRSSLGVRAFAGGRSDESLSSAVFLPTCNLCGFTGGYAGPGGKTVIPSRASCKIDFRLVPDQDPHEIANHVRTHLDRLGFEDVEMRVLDSVRPAMTDVRSPHVRSAVDAARDAWHAEPVVIPMMGGSGPMALFTEVLRLPVVSVGCSYPNARKHAPDEHIRIDHLASGAKHVARIMATFLSHASA